MISSSLHGIILAETYGISAVMLSDTPSSNITKYKDWYYATGRKNFTIVNSVEEGLKIKCEPLPITVIEEMQAQLIDTFPCDLWNG